MNHCTMFVIVQRFTVAFVFWAAFVGINAHAETHKVSDIGAIPWHLVKPGDRVEVSPGVHDSVFKITAKGTAQAPITISPEKGRKTVLSNSVIIKDSEHLVFEGFTVQDSFFPGIALRGRSHHITVRNNLIRDTGLGIWVTDQAGVGNRLDNNQISNSRTHGIAINKTNAIPTAPSVISNNIIFDNALHGIEIYGSHYIIEYNEVYENGRKGPGTSGIHVFARSAEEPFGDYNTIRYNTSYRNFEVSGPDGNGIQLDHWCDYNQIYHNLAYENDGAGISIYDAANNAIYFNTLYNNVIDPDGSHPYKAELLLASDKDNPTDHTRGMDIQNNIIVATRKHARAVEIDSRTLDNPNNLQNNLIFHSGDGNTIRLGRELIKQKPSREKHFKQGAPFNFRDNYYWAPNFLTPQPEKKDDFSLSSNAQGIGKAKKITQKTASQFYQPMNFDFKDLGARLQRQKTRR